MARRKRIDGNQPALVKTLRGIGAEWVQTTGDPLIGFDGIVCFRGQTWLVEVKDGAKRKSAQQLTEREQKRREQLARVGVEIHVIADDDSLLRLIGAIS